MKLLRLLCIFLLTWAVPASVSFAKVDDGILEHLSGPGPFARLGTFGVRVACITHVDLDDKNHTIGLLPWARGSSSEFGIKNAPKEITVGTVEQKADSKARVQCATDDKVRGYVTVTYGHYFSLENNLFPDDTTDEEKDTHKVKAHSVSLRFMGRTAGDVIDVGFGFNLFWFKGQAFDTFTRASVEPFRISVAPFAALKSTQRTRAFHVTVAPTIFIKKMDQDDFCTAPRCTGARPFSTHGEIVWATGIEADLLTLIRGH